MQRRFRLWIKYLVEVSLTLYTSGDCAERFIIKFRPIYEEVHLSLPTSRDPLSGRGSWLGLIRSWCACWEHGLYHFRYQRAVKWLWSHPSPCYARVSTEEQREGQTIDSQVPELERFCREKVWLVTGIYKDEGWSGGIMERRHHLPHVQAQCCL